MSETTKKPADEEHIVYVAVARTLLPKLDEWSRPVRVKVESESDGVVRLLVKEVLNA